MFGRFGRKRPGEYRTSEEIQALIDGDVPHCLVDVRTHDEYDQGHIPTATWIPYLDIGKTPPTEDKSALIIVYCYSGARSETARRTLMKMGYEHVYNFGGIIHWAGELV